MRGIYFRRSIQRTYSLVFHFYREMLFNLLTLLYLYRVASIVLLSQLVYKKGSSSFVIERLEG